MQDPGRKAIRRLAQISIQRHSRFRPRFRNCRGIFANRRVDPARYQQAGLSGSLPPYLQFCREVSWRASRGPQSCVPPEECRDNLSSMLRIEKAAGAHCLAFHSYDHVLENDGQLPQCREVNLQIRGYRAPQSRVTAELTDYAPSYYNFEWLATGLRSLIDSLPAHRDRPAQRVALLWTARLLRAVLDRILCGTPGDIVRNRPFSDRRRVVRHDVS
jgi:hypothetical protein